MPVCPRCRDEYRDGVERCAECDVPLAPEGAPLPPQVDAVLGRFHPAAVAAIVDVLERRGVAHEQRPLGDDRIEVVVDREFRDDLRAELVVNWSGLVGSLPEEERTQVAAAGGTQPGWFDAPRGAWMDAQGRLQVERTEEEELAADARRTVGPTMAAVGGFLLVFGWWAGSELAVVIGIAAVAIGLLLPT